MDLKALDLFLLTKLTSLYVDQVTCIECCKYFIAPETASCGHSLCHSCWRGRRTCPVCVSPLEKQSLKLNSHMQLLTAHIQELGEAFEQLFNIKLDEFVLDMSHTETELSADPTRNVKDWLASSQNHFPAPLRNSESSMHESNCITVSSNDVQIHDKTKKNVSSEKLIYVKQPQDDWDKIEQLPDTEEMPINKENILIPNNQILSIQDCEYTTDNPRRSSRKRDAISENTMKTQDMSFDKLNSKNSSSEIDKRSTTAKQNWNNVKRMRKEFSKLNKKNRNKLNVSIEMCKKNQQRIKSNLKETEQRVLKDIESHLYIIDDNTPVVDITTNNNNSGDILPEDNNENTLNNFNNNIKVNKNNESQICDEKINVDCNVVTDDNYENVLKTNDVSITKNKSSRMPFIKKGLLCPKQSCQNIEINGNSGVDKNIDDDIEISIKIGSTITNIIIKKKTNDIQLKINTDQEVQTSLGSFTLSDKNNFSSKNKNSKDQNDDLIIEKDKNVVDAQTLIKGNKTNAKEKSVSTKINTASAETVTAPFEITESVEKELSNIMECNESSNKKLNTHSMLCPSNSENNKTILNSRHKQATKEKVDDLDAFDGIFDIDYVEDDSVNMLGDSKLISSEILMPTDHSKKRSQAQKRDRDLSAEEVSIPEPKKIKSTVENNAPNKGPSTNNSVIADNDSINYDHVMDQVFANIDADMDKNQKKKSLDLQVSPKAVNLFQPIQDQKFDNQKFSENIFTITENETEALEVIRKDNDNNGSTQRHVENLLTPGISEDILSTNPTNLVKNVELVENQVCTPCEDNDDSDKCIVEETPQKNVSFSKTKTKTNTSIPKGDKEVIQIPDNIEVLKSVIDISSSVVDSIGSGNRVTVVENTRKPPCKETPLTINKFIDQIKHNSTPKTVARKSLNFESENIDVDDLEQTICPSSVVAKTTQEKEFMCKAFEPTPTSPVKKHLLKNYTKSNELKYCIAGSCLSVSEINNVKLLCRKYNWKYVDKYTKELTHLVVGVDKENKSQRSVKYVCALAASKWIVSYQWVEGCLTTNLVLRENPYEALDGTGEPGPKRSRLAKKKLFDGITFFCMPPFSVLDTDTLKEMLESSGGIVVSDAKSLMVNKESPSLLLAEPENTQEDRFVYLALELGIVPVNYEWALNCLGSYTLSSIHNLLLCPAAILPPITASWPAIIISQDSE